MAAPATASARPARFLIIIGLAIVSWEVVAVGSAVAIRLVGAL